MTTLEGSLTYVLTVNQADLNLIGLALCGRVVGSQVEAARQLNMWLLDQRKQILEKHLRNVTSAMKSLEDQDDQK